MGKYKGNPEAVRREIDALKKACDQAKLSYWVLVFKAEADGNDMRLIMDIEEPHKALGLAVGKFCHRHRVNVNAFLTSFCAHALATYEGEVKEKAQESKDASIHNN